MIFTYNPVSMYTNIGTEECISQQIEEYLWHAETFHRFHHKHPQAIISTMTLVMQKNRMQFGDLDVHQTKGIAMGMSPAPTIANLFIAIYEAKKIIPLIGTYLLLLR